MECVIASAGEAIQKSVNDWIASSLCVAGNDTKGLTPTLSG
jgi:hypothetical protein